MGKYLTKDDILGADDLAWEDVHVPEWIKGEAAYVRVYELSGTERSQYQASLIEMDTEGKSSRVVLENADVRLAALSIRDEKGERLFSLADVEVLGRKSARALNRVVEVAQKLSALRKKDVEELVGKSGATETSDSA